MVTKLVADPSAHAPDAYNYEKRCHFSVSPISRGETVDKGKPTVNTQFLNKMSSMMEKTCRKFLK